MPEQHASGARADSPHPRPWDRVLVVGAGADALLDETARRIRAVSPRAHITLLIARDRADPGLAAYSQVLRGTAGGMVEDADFANLGSFDAAVLAMSHVARASYPGLCARTLEHAPEACLSWGGALDPMDARETLVSWPEPIKGVRNGRRGAGGQKPAEWLFFRPSDQTVWRRAEALAAEGARVRVVQTLAALEAALPRAQAAFFDWCITDYGALFAALRLCIEAGLYTEAFLALDLADLAEDPAVAARIITLNRTALPRLDRVNVLFSRTHLLDRYPLSPQRCAKVGNLPDPKVWAPGPATPRQPAPPTALRPLRLAYHGLFYFWHEVAEFVPVYERLRQAVPVKFDLFGRVHESVSLGGTPLFPRAQQKVERALEKLKKFPEVALHPFTGAAAVRGALEEADLYVGITAGTTLMARTELRTGLVEALCAGVRPVHRRTPATDTAELIPGRDFVAVNSRRPSDAARAVLQACGLDVPPPPAAGV